MKTRGMQLNKNKIKIMEVNTNNNINLLDLKIQRVQIKEVKEFRQLGSKIIDDEKYKYEIRVAFLRLKRYFSK